MNKQATFTRVPLGTTIATKLVSRCDVAEGTKGRVVPISEDVVGISCFFTENPKGNWLCSPEEALSIGISPRFYYVIPVFRLNTGSKAEVLDTSVKLEYLRLGAQQYEELSAAMAEQEGTPSIVIKKIKKGEYSYVDPVASAKPLPEEVTTKLQEMRESLNEDQVFAFCIADIARPFSAYLAAVGAQPQAGAPAPAPQNALPGRPQATVPTGIPPLNESLEEADEFEEED